MVAKSCITKRMVETLFRPPFSTGESDFATIHPFGVCCEIYHSSWGPHVTEGHRSTQSRSSIWIKSASEWKEM